jgi:hypothetical protein
VITNEHDPGKGWLIFGLSGRILIFIPPEFRWHKDSPGKILRITEREEVDLHLLLTLTVKRVTKNQF